MWLLIKTAWRNLFRQRRRTIITVTAMAFSLVLAIPTWGLTEGLTKEMLRGITRMDLGHVQVHDPAYPRGKAMQSMLRRPDFLLKEIRKTPGVVVAGPRVHGFALASHDVKLTTILAALPKALPAKAVLFGRAPDARAPWRTDRALACEALVDRKGARKHAIVVGTVLTPGAAKAGGRCERVRVVGVTHDPLPGYLTERRLIIGMPAPDLVAAFGKAPFETPTILRHSATLQIEGVDPPHERRLTFMSDKLIPGDEYKGNRYLGPKPGWEIVVGYRLATIMRLKVGSKIFVQAASLDQSKGEFSQTFKVVGIYRTGVEMLDRARVFVHYKDAQRIMSLDNRVHEIAVVGKDARNPLPLADELKKAVSTRLRIVTGAPGKRAGSRPLAAPMTVYEPANGDAALIIPYDLKRRFDDLKGLDKVVKRVYGATRVARATRVKVEVKPQPKERLAELVGAAVTDDPCTIYPPQGHLKELGVKTGDVLRSLDALTGNENGCTQVNVGAPFDPKKLGDTDAKVGEVVLSLAPALQIAAASDDGDDEGGGLEEGGLELVKPGPAQRLRLVGVEAVLERHLSGLHKLLATGAYLRQPGEAVEEAARWPVLVPQRVARRLGAKVGTTVLLEAIDGEGKKGWRAARIKGVLRDTKWPKDLPELVMGYYAAQQVDAPRLNARAHEMLLLPKLKADHKALVAGGKKRLAPLVRTWQQIAPDMATLIKLQDTWVAILLVIIFALAAMTVMNTMLMAVFERTREFGVLKAIGMKPGQVFWLIVFETLALAVIAVVIGGAGGLALNHWAVVSGIDLSKWTGGFTYQGTFINPVWHAAHSVKVIAVPMIMVQVVCLLVSIYPAARAGRLKPVKAMRHQG
jgi:ABC-type lipoprotein release transport system permease subunit